MQVSYHSVYGALQESRHVFIETGLNYFLNRNNPDELFLLEAGFGTGLNAFLTLEAALQKNLRIHYYAVEAYPLKDFEWKGLEYEALAGKNSVLQQAFEKMHTCEWDTTVLIHDSFFLTKHHQKIQQIAFNKKFHLIYYDAFAPSAQPELWSTEIFNNLFGHLLPGGILVTYCSKSEVRKNLAAAGFQVNKVKGPPGKREIVRAVKPSMNLQSE